MYFVANQVIIQMQRITHKPQSIVHRFIYDVSKNMNDIGWIK